LFLTALTLAISCVGARASAGSVDSSDQRVEAARFQVKASNGFEADVDAGAGRVHLTLIRTLKHKREFVRYVAEAEVSTQGIKAEFGSLGSIDVAFHPAGVAEGLAPPAGCDGYYVKGRSGTFTGAIHFRGEEGYARINAERAKGKVGASSRWDCHRSEETVRRQDQPLRRLSAQVRDEEAQAREYGHLTAYLPGQRFFRAVGGPDANGRFGPAFFVAATFERGEPVEITREVAVEDFREDFRFDEDLGSAAVRPGPPFVGSARFTRGAGDATHWAGSLKVSLPGLRNVFLVGPGFKSQLSHDLPGD
jgi:hypothetical protein